MISATSNYGYKQTFTSVVPVKVKIDTMETFDSKFVSSACNQLSKILTGPTKQTNTHAISIIRNFAQHDPDYNFLNGLNGFPKLFKKSKVVPSDYFRYVAEHGKHYFITGKQAEIIRNNGIAVGLARHNCKVNEVSDSFDLQFAQKEYWETIKRFITNKKLRLTEDYKQATAEKIGEPVTLVINMKSNGKYGKTTNKMTIDSIEFEKA